MLERNQSGSGKIGSQRFAMDANSWSPRILDSLTQGQPREEKAAKV
jgi:hypothetical protein